MARTRKNPLSWALIALAAIGLIFSYLMLRPAKNDMCASEILTNGRGLSVNLAAKTVRLEGSSKPVPLDKISDRSALVIDTLSRLCRERQNGSISGPEYASRFNDVMKPVIAKTPAQSLPLFKGDVIMTGTSDNAPFIRFLQEHDNKVVRLDIVLDYSWDGTIMHPEKKILALCDPKRQINGDFDTASYDPFNREIMLPAVAIPLGTEPILEDETQVSKTYLLCSAYSLHFHTSRKPVWSSGGTGILTLGVDGFFRVEVSRIGGEAVFNLTELSGSPGDFAET